MSDQSGQPPAGFNRTKRQWARGFLWATSGLLIFDKPFMSLVTSACAVYTMHGGTWLSHKNLKWMGASIISFLISLYSLTLRTESYFVDEEKAYELKTMLDIKHRHAEIMWGVVLLLLLALTIKEKIETAVVVTRDTVAKLSSDISNSDSGAAKIKSG
mmetsp:Transcript_35791/g.61030  ORF Transcript_35791/g.61030 Transcript_35791/m.61030 type:complete len:158 (-) Transcript_35791:1007-1480(-)